MVLKSGAGYEENTLATQIAGVAYKQREFPLVEYWQVNYKNREISRVLPRLRYQALLKGNS